MGIAPLFPTPLWSFRYELASQIDCWSDHILTLEAGDPDGLQLTNQGGWHSQSSLLDDLQLRDLFLWIAQQVRAPLGQFGWDFSKAQPCFNNAWAMVSRGGHAVRAHLHPNSLFSGVIYLTAPQGAGSIVFLDPRAGAQVLMPPILPTPQVYAQGRVSRIPLAGETLIFPSWLWHEVEPNSPEMLGERISISFNIGMKPIAM